MKIEHIGIAVSSLEESEKLFERLLGEAPYKREEVLSEQVMTSFFQVGESKVELLAATGDESPIARFLQKRGEGTHHVAFEVENIVEEMERLRKEGFTLLNDKPKIGADNKLVCFIHPKSANGVLVELCQQIRNDDTSAL